MLSGLSASYASWMGNCRSGNRVQDPLEKLSHTHSLMEEVGGSVVSQAESVVEGSLVEAEAMVSYRNGCEASWKLPFHLLTLLPF